MVKSYYPETNRFLPDYHENGCGNGKTKLLIETIYAITKISFAIAKENLEQSALLWVY